MKDRGEVNKRLEEGLIHSPSDATFQGLTRATGRTFEELKAIARQEDRSEVREVHVAEDVLPLVNQLSNAEAARLAQMIVARLAQIEVVEELRDLRVGEMSVDFSPA